MSAALAHITRAVTQSRSRRWIIVAATSLLLSGGALAQTAGDANRAVGGGAQNTKVQAVYAEWRKLSQNEVNCVDQSLRTRKSSLWFLIQRGIDPSDSTVASARAACRAHAKAPENTTAARNGSQALAAAVETVPTDKAAADKTAADKAVTDKAAADKAAEKAAANKAIADKAAADRAAADKAVEDRVAADKAIIDRVAADSAKADSQRAKTDAAEVQADAEGAPKELEKPTVRAGFMYAAAESRMSFLYGLISGPIIFGFGGLAFLFAYRKRNVRGVRFAAENQREFERLVTAVLAEAKRREAKVPLPIASDREQQIDQAILH